MIYKRLILIRHAESIYNLEGKFCGHTDADLTDTGSRAARSLTSMLTKTLKMSSSEIAIYSSPLRRCTKTIEGFAKAVSVVPMIDKDLIEVNFGKWEGFTADVVSKQWPEQYEMWSKRKLEMVFPGGDVFLDYTEKIQNAVAKIVESATENYVVICTHSTPVRILVSAVLAGDMSLVPRLYVRNASITTIKYGFSLEGDVTKTLSAYNSVIHDGLLDI